MAVHENIRNRAQEALREVTETAGRTARAFIGLAFVLACIPVNQRALAAAATDEVSP